jgi:hypothetical protein
MRNVHYDVRNERAKDTPVLTNCSRNRRRQSFRRHPKIRRRSTSRRKTSHYRSTNHGPTTKRASLAFFAFGVGQKTPKGAVRQ